MRVVYFGTPVYAVPTFQALMARSEDYEVAGVVTQPDRRRGRGNSLVPSAVKKALIDLGAGNPDALSRAIPIFQPARIKKDTETLEKLAALKADLFVVVAYGQILSQEILDMPKYGCVNGHGSLLPAYRGAAPIQWSLCNGDIETGVTTMLMDAGMDTGAMLLKSTTPIAWDSTAHDLAGVLAQQTADLMLGTLPKLAAGEITPERQDSEAATYARLIQKKDYQLDWSCTAVALHNQIRGFYPNCVTAFRGKALKILETVPLSTDFYDQLPAVYRDLVDWLAAIEPAKPGRIWQIVKNLGPIVATGDGGLLLKTVKLAGKKVQSGGELANGQRMEMGERLTD
ncbi:MAG: methionyl-tRNA formyltransferase [Cyanobacteria bacterium P01_H01_bin.15]